MVRFADANFPNIEYGLGIGIYFNKEDITGIEILSLEDEIEKD